MGYLEPSALSDDRIRAGHPEGLFEAWSNLYSRFACAMDAADRGKPSSSGIPIFMQAQRASAGWKTCVRSTDSSAVWVGLSITSWRRFKELSKRPVSRRLLLNAGWGSGRCWRSRRLLQSFQWIPVSASIILACFKRSPRRY